MAGERWLAIGATLSLLGSAVSGATQVLAPETIAEGIRDRSDRIETLQGSATVQCWYSPAEVEFRAAKWQQPGLGARGLARLAFWIAGDQWRIEVLELIGAGDTLLGGLDTTGEDPAACGIDQPHRYSCCVSDGTTVWEYRSTPQPTIARHFSPSELDNAKFQLLRELLLLPSGRGLTQALGRHEHVDVAGPQEVAGATCMLLRLSSPTHSPAVRVEMAVAPEAGYAVVRYRSFTGSPDDHLLGLSEMREARGLTEVAGGVWLPSETTVHTYRYPAQGDPWAYTRFTTFDSLSVNEPIVPPPAVFRAPIGSMLWDQTAPGGMRQGWFGLGDAPSILDDMKRGAEPPVHTVELVRALLPPGMVRGDPW
ncbi:MAG: hypothetical protein FJX75_07630 [Armatimonadetes bacterium]|nr:hypothetical protein [Armatimonadota bacterium]